MAGSSYLKAMQMRKQLEEKAKDAIKKRQQTEEMLTGAKDRLVLAKSSDVDVSKAEEFFTKSNASMADKDYDAALSHAQQGMSELDKAYSDVALTIAEATSKLTDLLKEQGVNIDDIDKIFRSADSMLGGGKPEDGLKLAKEGWKAAEKAVHERLSSQFSSAQSLIMVAKKQGDDVAAAEDLLSRARTGLESQDYAAALSLTQECLDLVSGSLDSEVAEDLDTAKSLMQAAKELGADTSKAEELIARTEEDITAFNFERALNSATLAKGESEKALVRGLSDSGDGCAREIASAQEIDADTKATADHLSRSRHALKNGNYEEAVAALKSAREELRNSQFQRVLATISLSRSKFLTATKMGADLGEAMNYLNKARDALKDARFKEALEFAQLGDDSVDSLVRDYQDSEESLKHLSQSIADAMQLGIETSTASDFYQQAQQALEGRDLNKVAILVHKGLSEVESSLYKYAMEHFEVCELIVSTGDRIGARMDEARQHMIDSSKAMREKRFMDASTLADQAAAQAESSIRDHVAGFLVTVELALSQAEIVDSEAPKDLLVQAKASFDQNAYDAAYDLASQAFSVVDMDSSRKAREILNSAEVEISLAQTMDCDISGILDSLRQANAAFARKEYPTVVKLAQDMKANARTLQYGAAERVFSNAKVLAVEAKKIGIDITDIRETLKQAKASFDVEQYKKAFELSGTVVKSASRMIELRKKAYDNITQAAALVAEAKKNKADVEPVMSALLDAKTSFEHFDYVRAAELAEKAKDETRSLMALYTAANKLITVRDNIRLLEGLNGEKAESVLQQTENVKTMLKAKDYDLALSVLDRVEKEVNDKLANRVSGLISEAEAGIEDAVEIGIKVDSATTLVQKGRNYMAAHAFKEAIESVQAAKKDVEGIREMSQRAARLVKEAHERVGECESMHADSSEARSMLEKAMSSIKSSDYVQAIEFGEKAVESAKASVTTYVSDTLHTFKLATERAKMEGVNVAAAERLIDDARKAMEEGHLKKALEFAMRSEGELEKVGLQQDMASKAIKTAEEKLADSRSKGIYSKSAESMLARARDMIKNGDYVKALEVAVQSGDELHRAREDYEEAMDMLKKASDALAVTQKIGEAAPEVEGLINAASGAISGFDYSAAREKASDAITEAKRLSYSMASNLLVTAHNLVNTAARIGLRVTEAQTMITEAKSFLDNSRFESAHDAAKRAIDFATNLLKTHTNSELDAVNAEILHAAQLGGETAQAEKLLAQARDALKVGSYQSAAEQARKAREAIVVKRAVEKGFMDLTQQASTAIANAKKFGLPVKEAERLLSLGIAAEGTNKDEAAKLVKQAYDTTAKSLEEFRPVLAIEVAFSSPLKKGAWVDGKVKVTNTGKTFGKDIKVQLMGAAEIDGTLTAGMLRGGGGSVELPVKFRFTEGGEIPLVIKASAVRALDGAEFLSEASQHVLVAEDVAAPKLVSKWIVVPADAPGKCSVCMGNIKQAMKVVKCSCGRVMHEPCGMRAGKCPGCGTMFRSDLTAKEVEDELFNGGAKPRAPPEPTPVQPAPAAEKPVEPAPVEKPAEQQPAQPPAEEPKPEEAQPEQPKKKRVALRIR